MSLQSEILSLLKMLAPNDPEMGKVRVGSLGDGGYVLPDDLDQIDSVLSIGIGNEDSFDLHFAKKNIPIVVPGWEDSTMGNIFASYCIKGTFKP